MAALDNWWEDLPVTAMPEETKPVEREANPDEQRRRDEQWGRQVASLADYNAGWDAALERAAEVAENMAHELESLAGGCDVQGLMTTVMRQRAIARRQVAEQIRALKGSR